ncbi:MAG: HU family DNA-binding protein [Holosporaceae bacterium]|jgi:DNA-binding protein HU-beta|nr:HU family DNA-binding protein [Holosporaceae bacterium]
MNKSELVDAVSKDSGLTKSDSEKAVNSFICVIGSVLEKGDEKGVKEVALVGFGIFSVNKTSGRSGRNFKTGAAIEIPPRNTIRFKAGKNLKERVNCKGKTCKQLN